jgi:predicted transcriptional regulator
MVSKSAKTASRVRASITFDPEHYTQIQKVANEMRVSVAWVVRAAIEQYLRAEDHPKNNRQRRME